MTDDPVCTDCHGTGITIQTERRCPCQPALSQPTEPNEVREDHIANTGKMVGEAEAREVLEELERYANTKTAQAHTAMHRAFDHGDCDFGKEMNAERKAYSDMTMRLRAILAALHPGEKV